MSTQKFLDKDGLVEVFRLCNELGDGSGSTLSEPEINQMIESRVDTINEGYANLKALVEQRIADGKM